ncbi:MAG TPA: type II toxin-antitoxin system VapB family antitoxin [Acidobacteriaceae bacterium]|jgi:antitoxin VapB|nr:type II toxin-antitoxin system VapB family antitoxin [Acidobacteriaceae bacterium]
MALSIRNAETEKLAREVALLTGETLTDAISKSLAERLQRLKRGRQNVALRKEIDEILTRVHALPVLDDRPEEEILGYDQNGIPF